MLTKDEMQRLLDQMAAAYASGDALGCASLFALDAQLHSPFAPPAVGRAAIQELHESWVSEPDTKSFSILDYGSSGNFAWCLSRFNEGDGGGGGTSLIVLERSPQGHWLIRSCCLHGDPETE